MNSSTGFLGGAKDRLLPASLPFRFFLSASVFHILAWAVLFTAADDLAGFTGGVGPVVSAIHLATLGVFVTTAIGASFQLLPVVTRQPLARDWPVRFSFWLLVPGIALLSWGMAVVAVEAMKWGTVLVMAGLAVFAVLTADNLRRAGSMPVVAAHGWGALLVLICFAAVGVLLVWDLAAGFLENRSDLAVQHMIMAVFGFMGMLVLGLSLVLIPMFTLSRSPKDTLGWAQLFLAAIALVSFVTGFVIGNTLWAWVALVLGLSAAASHLWLMRKTLRSRMRKRLGLSFVLIRVAWVLAVVSLVLGGVVLAGANIPNVHALFGFMILAGWLLTFLTGVLQRIIPFLASMHASDASGLPPLLSELTAEGPLKLHAICHCVALVACIPGILLDHTLLIQIGTATGGVGALAFAIFNIKVALHLRW